MSARRAVGAAKRGTNAPADARAERAARARVQDAKVALGERGPKWWEGHDETGWRARIEACLLALLRAREPASSLCPSDAARAAGGEDWRERMGLVRDVAVGLAAQGIVEVARAGVMVEPDARGAVRVRRGPRFDAPGPRGARDAPDRT